MELRIDPGLRPYFQQLVSHLKANSSDTEIVLTEFHSIINKFDPQIQMGQKAPLPLVNADFKPRVKSVRHRIYETIGRKIRIPDLRFEADRLSQICGIALPTSTRKNNEALMQWFDVYWMVLQPRLRELNDGRSA
jgi:hypothetical protein